MRRIHEFVEIKALVDVFNERGHKGFRAPINPFFWWNKESEGMIDDNVYAYLDDGVVIVLELENKDMINNLLIFNLSGKKNVLKMILDIIKDYDILIYNSEYHDRYKGITRRFGGSSWFSNGRYYYAVEGRKAWELSKKPYKPQ